MEPEEEEDEDEESRETRFAALHYIGRLPTALLVSALQARVPIALVQGLRRKGNSVHAFTIGIHRGHSQLHADAAAKTTEVAAGRSAASRSRYVHCSS